MLENTKSNAVSLTYSCQAISSLTLLKGSHAAGMENLLFVETYFILLHMYSGIQSPKNWGMREEPASSSGSDAGCQALTVAAMEAKAVAACRAGITAASHDVGFALTLAPQFTTVGIQRPLGIALTCWQGERKSKQVWLSRSVTALISLQVSHFKIGRKKLDYYQGFTNLMMAMV